MIWPSNRFDISLQNFKKRLDISSPQIERKRSKEYLVIILAVKESFERFSCLEFIFEKSKTQETGLQSNQVKRTPQESINEFIIQKLNPLLVVDFRLISAFLHV